ncbi:MAG: hypothetical protein VB070_08790 [Clostridiaceae bacterium]|nr:hypothetical protein [Clostridiaceae bacterium]
MKRKKFLAVLLAAGMLLSLSACSGAPGSLNDTSAESGTGSAASTESSTGSAVSTENTFAGYPVDTDITLTMWNPQVASLHSSYTSYTESPFHTGLEEKTGIKVDWQFPVAGTDRTQAYNLMLASDTLPDIIVYTLFNDAQQYIDDGIIRDLTDVMPEYSPDYWKVLQNNERFDKSMKTDAGQYWGYGSFRESAWAATYCGPVVRQDWLDEQNLEMPKTISDWDNVIRTFNRAYEAKLAFAITRTNPGFASAFGAYTSFSAAKYVDDNGKVQYAIAQPEWKNYMTQLHSWYSDGMIDTDSVTLDDAGVRSKVLNNKVGVSITAISQLTNWVNDAKAENTGAEWVGAPYVPQTAGSPVNYIQGEDMVSVYAAAITTSCPDEKLETAMRWLNYGYNEEGFMYWNYGTEGKTYTMVNGVPTYTDLLTKDPEGINMALSKYVGTVGTGLAMQAENMVRQKNAPASVAAVDTWTGQKNELFDHMYPAGVSLTTGESTEVSSLAAAIDTYASEMALKFFTGEESLNNFDQFVETLKGMNLERMLEIYQAAYDRFTAR